MTVIELSEHRGINRASAGRLIRRHKWPKRKDNLGRVIRYLIPEHELEPTGRPTDSRKDDTIRALETAIGALQTELTARRAEVEALRQAEAERRAGTRWARLRAAWRGD